jgi:NAD(P)H dehydrogenase (quinone)
MSEKRLLVIYHTEGVRTMLMAGLIGQTAREHGLEVDVKSVHDINTPSFTEYDGIVIGSPTYFSNVSWQIKKLLDETHPLRRGGFKLKGKIGGGFTSSDTRVDGEDCVRMIDLALNVHHEMETVPGIIVTRGETDAEIYEMCRSYGAEIAKKILGA